MITSFLFTKLCKYPEYDEVHKIIRDYVDKDEYTLELHIEMKTMYENLDKFDFYKWHQEKKNYFKDILCGYLNSYQRVCKFFIVIIHQLKDGADDNISFELLYSEEATRFLGEMICTNFI